MKPEILVAPDLDCLARQAAQEFARLAGEALRRSGRFTVALSGGSTPLRLYALLGGESGEAYRSQIVWETVHLFWGDERAVPPEHPESNYGNVRRALLDRVPLPAANVHRIRGEDPDPGRAARHYEQELRFFFHLKRRTLPRFDLVLLGMGTDGHTASLFPDSAALHEKSRLAVATPDPRGDDRGQRITLSLPVLNNAERLLFLVTGGDKAAMLRRILGGHPDPDPPPAARVRPRDGRLSWLVDAAAATGIAPTPGDANSGP